MPDVRTPVATLQTDFADNSAGDISANDGRNVIVSCHPTKVIQSDTQANEPSADLLTGDLFLPNNGFQLERYSGSAWQPWGPLFPFTKPVDGDFSWLNQGSASVSTTNGGIFLAGVADGSESIRARVKAVPSAPYSVTIAFLPRLFSETDGTFPNCGICLTDGTNAGSSKVLILGLYHLGGTATEATQIYSRKYDNATTFNTNGVIAAEHFPYRGLVFLRITDNSTNRLLEFSLDGQNFLTLGSESRTAFLTPTHIGFYTNAHAASHLPAMTLLSWKEA